MTDSTNNIEVTAVLPVYNDRKALEKAIPVSIAALENCSQSFELIVAEDGSTDGSRECVESWMQKDNRVRLLHRDERQGRGKALNHALANAHGSIFCYYDVDLATDIKHLPELIDHIRNGADVATGSRLMKESKIIRSGDREFASRGFNTLVRIFLGSHLHDHQCGFKAYNTSVLRELVPKLRSPHWFWDTESLILAQRAKLRVDEFPITWTQGPGTTVRLKDVVNMGSDILKLWWRIHVEKN